MTAKMRVAVVYRSFLDGDGERRVVGGVETYIERLAAALSSGGHECFVFQPARHDFRVVLPNCTVLGRRVGSSSTATVVSRLRNAVDLELGRKNCITIFGADTFSVASRTGRRLLLQHGILWDVPDGALHKLPILPLWLSAKVVRAIMRRRALRQFDNCRNRVCVDYNFTNWYSTFRDPRAGGCRVWIVPNCAAGPTSSRAERGGAELRVIFARRFTRYRGVELMASCVQQLLGESPDYRFTFAGEGPGEAHLRRLFGGEERVSISRYDAAEAVDIHCRQDVAVVPSLGSEGTAFAAIEAMAAGCAIVATPVGGLSSVVIDQFNGLFVEPQADALVRALRRLHDEPETLCAMAARGRALWSASLSFDAWRRRWLDIIAEVSEENDR